MLFPYQEVKMDNLTMCDISTNTKGSFQRDAFIDVGNGELRFYFWQVDYFI